MRPRILTTIAAVAALLVSSGCAKPLPPEKLHYAGEWRGPGMLLVISPEGTVRYERKEGNSSTSINAPITEFDGNDFLVGMGGLTTRFVVPVPPHQANGGWEMTVDGVDLRRVDGSAEAGAVEST
jgi:hypothetical protein